MLRTEYSWMTNEELVSFVYMHDAPPSIAIELAQRLQVMMDGESTDTELIHDARRPRKVAS